MLERELRVAGVGVVDQQPLLVMANTLGITFNADLAALDTGDLSAVYINPDDDSSAVDVLRTSAEDHAAGYDEAVSGHELHAQRGSAQPRRDDLVLVVS